MKRLPLFRLVSGGAVALLGLVVLGANYMNMGYFADLGDTARQVGDDGTAGSLLSLVAGILLVALGVASAAMSHLEVHPVSAAGHAEEPQAVRAERL